MKVSLTSASSFLQYNASTAAANISVGANQHVSSQEATFRPMELLLASLASCSAIDIETILHKQKQSYQYFKINASGKRAKNIPTVFIHIHVELVISDTVNTAKLERAIELTKNKYCSVYRMLHEQAEISYSYTLTNVS